MVFSTLVLTGCSLDSLLKSDRLPPDVTDPAITQTPDGARAAYNATLAGFRAAFGSPGIGSAGFVAVTGLLSDELGTTNNGDFNDRRLLVEDGNSGASDYGALQQVRGQGGQTIGLLTTYLPAQPALAGHIYALEAYIEVFLAELYCSGIPLSTLDFGGDFTYRPGSPTGSVFAHALALFDTALTLTGDSARFVHLAAVGKARALLALGNYAAAATAVAGVPDGYRYEVNFTNTSTTSSDANFAQTMPTFSIQWRYSVADREGTNGLDYRTSGDPRTAVRTQGTYTVGPSPGTTYTLYHPSKYDTLGTTPIVVASGLEARLIEAEAALQAGDAATWLAKLNALRTDGTQDGGGTYNPGTGGVAGLAPLADPGTVNAQVDLLFRERAFWLFLTGHRQGDLRRLIREYGRSEDQVYPVGDYPAGSSIGDQYGGDVTLPIPSSERASNPLFTGCLSREA